MNRIGITKKIALTFNEKAIAITPIEEALQEVRKEYSKKYTIDERNIGLSVENGFLYITIVARELKETKAIGFKRG